MSDLVVPTEQKQLKAFIARRHPEYADNVTHWNFLQATYEGGRPWFANNIFRYMKEGKEEFTDRLRRAYRFNHTREVVDLVNKYIFKTSPIRNRDDASATINQFWLRADRAGLPIDQFMKMVSQKSSIFGRIWVCVDNNKTDDVETKAEETAADVRTYAYIITPQQVLDVSYDSMNRIRWMLVLETHREDLDPFNSSGTVSLRYRLWTVNDWLLFEVQGTGAKAKVVLVDQGMHGLGRVPIFPVDHTSSDDLYSAPALINDVAYLDRAVGNYLSNLDAIIQDQTFSQLAMPAQGLMAGEDMWDKLMEMGTKRIFLYDGEGGSAPIYVSPDVRQANVIVAVVNKIIGEIYHTIGMAGERTKQDNVSGIDNSSGVAKAYDFERLNSLLASKADALQACEDQLIDLVNLWNGVAPAQGAPEEGDGLVKYPDSYDVRSLYDEFDVATRLALIEAPDAVRQEQMKDIIDKLFPRLSKDLKAKMLAQVKSWPPPPELPAGQGNSNTVRESPQGESKVSSQLQTAA